MGVTQISLDRITPYLKTGMRMLELGAQNLYDNNHYGWVAKDYFETLFVEHTSIDIIQHQKCEYADLREVLSYKDFDIVTNFGTLEHVDGSLYIPFLNIHNACKPGGIMIHENPLTKNWPLHGQHYFTEQFYTELAKVCGYEVLELASEASMGNFVDGWNVSCVMRKGDGEFCSQSKFDKIYGKFILPK